MQMPRDVVELSRLKGAGWPNTNPLVQVLDCYLEFWGEVHGQGEDFWGRETVELFNAEGLAGTTYNWWDLEHLKKKQRRALAENGLVKPCLKWL